eukprot:SAG22_NODE_56_length_23716_cov_11.146759_24_plen_73_part_00
MYSAYNTTFHGVLMPTSTTFHAYRLLHTIYRTTYNTTFHGVTMPNSTTFHASHDLQNILILGKVSVRNCKRT